MKWKPFFSPLNEIFKNLISFHEMDRLKNTKEITFRETVTVLSRGQGYLSRSCKKNKRNSNHCALFKAKSKCNSRCHGSTNCLNKLLNLKNKTITYSKLFKLIFVIKTKLLVYVLFVYYTTKVRLG